MSTPTPSDRTPETHGDYSPTVKPGSTAGSSSKPTSPFSPPEVNTAASNAKFGKFVRTQRLGAGGMGEVWKAWDTQLSRWVALKFLKGGDDDEILRFKREAQTAGQLSHPNIAAVYEVGEDQGRHYIAMQYVDGQTLKTFPRNDRRSVARLCRDAARAVAYAHEQGIVHRDLKPENLMVTQRGREPHIYVMDFGLARALEGGSELSISGSVVGTPSYMPPEQARGERVDERADVYSLGATIYELLTDRVPFKGANVYETLRRVQEEEPTAPRKIDPKVDSDLETIVLKCMEKEPLRRYGTAKELAEDIDRFLEGEPIAARRASPLYRWRRKLAKRKAVVLTVLGAVVVVGIVLAVLVPKLRQKQEEYKKAQRELVEQMRTTSNACLETTLELRRVGKVDIMPKYAVKMEEACREVAEKIPGLAEPNYRLGRMYRAQMRDDDGWREQEAALKKEPAFPPSIYERAVLRLRRYRASLLEGAVNAELKKQIAADLADLEKALAAAPKERPEMQLSPQELACLRGLKAWIAAAPEAGFLAEAKKKTPVPDEAFELLVVVELEGERLEEAVRWLTAALEFDKGFAALYWNRATVNLRRGDFAAVAGDADEAFKQVRLYAQGIETLQKDLVKEKAKAEAEAAKQRAIDKEKARTEEARAKEVERTMKEVERWPAMVDRWNAPSHELRGLARLKLAKDSKAVRSGLDDLTTAIKLDPAREPKLRASIEEGRKRLEE